MGRHGLYGVEKENMPLGILAYGGDGMARTTGIPKDTPVGANEAKILYNHAVMLHEAFVWLRWLIYKGCDGVRGVFLIGFCHEESSELATDVAIVDVLVCAQIACTRELVGQVHAGINGHSEVFLLGPLAYG